MSQRVVWDKRALEDWRKLDLRDAKAVAVAVQAWVDRGDGLVIFVEGEYRLFVGPFIVAMLLDSETVYVDRIRRS
jgi:hypothetical protein